MLKLSKVFLSNKVHCLGLHKSRVCFLWLFIWRGCKIFCQLEHEHSRSYCRVTRLNKLLFLFALRKINMQCCPLALHVPPFPCFLVPPLPCFLVPLFPCSPVPLFPCSPVTSVSLFPCSPVLLLPSSPVSLFSCSLVPLLSCYPVPPFPCFLVPLFPFSPVTLFPHYPVSQWICGIVPQCTSVNLKFFTQMERPHRSVNGRGIFTWWVSERLMSIFHRFWKCRFSRTEMPFLRTDVRACISSKRSKIGNFF